MLAVTGWALTAWVPSFAETLPVLKAEQVVTVFGIQAGSNMGQVRCDSDGNVYFRTYVPDQALSAPVVSIVPDGTRYTSYDVGPWRDDPNLHPQVRDFAIAAKQLVLLAQNEQPPSQLIRFNTDGQYRTTTNLEVPWTPVRLAVFPEGGLLMLGMRSEPAARGQRTTFPVGGVFDDSGRLSKEVRLPFTVPKEDGKDNDVATLEVLDRMLIASGPTGIYLMPISATPTVVVLSTSGAVGRKLSLISPGPGFLPNSIRASASQILVEYAKAVKGQPDQRQYVFYDVNSGKPTNKYDGGDVRGSLACFDENQTFTFLSERESQRVLVRARP